MGVFAHGTVVTIDSVDIGGLRGIDGPQEEKELVDVTDHDSGGDKEYVPGLRDGGTLTLNALEEAADPGQQALWASYGDNTNTGHDFTISPPEDPTVSSDTFVLSFSGFVIGRSPGHPYDGVATIDYTIKISGAVTNSLVSV